MSTELIFALVCGFGALAYGVLSVKWILAKPTGNERMREIAGAIQEGADAFIRHEYKIILGIAIAIAVLLGVVVSWYTGAAFILGALMSASAGWIGPRARSSAARPSPSRSRP